MPEQEKRMPNKLTAITYAIALLALLIAVRIEVLNNRAGGMLPNREYRNNDPEQGVVKWRQSIWIDEQMWRRVFLSDENSDERPLTPAEQARMEQDIRNARINNELRWFVSSAGLLQYLLAPLVIMLSGRLMLRRPRSLKRILLGALPLAIGIGAGILMLHRAYCTSLGG